MTRLILLSAFVLVMAVPIATQERSTFKVGNATSVPGQKVTGTIEVPAGVDPALSIPVVVVHGALFQHRPGARRCWSLCPVNPAAQQKRKPC